MNERWTEADLPDLTGKRVIVTGGNSGIGLEASVALARSGAKVVIACRDPKRAEGAVATIRERAGKDVEAMQLDLSRLSSVRDFTDEILKRGDALDVLVNNAGVMAVPFGKTEDGYETQFATNHLGHFALSLRLLPALERAPSPRIVTVSSLTHTSGKLRLDTIHDEKSYSPSGAYATSKLANVLFAYELDRRLRTTNRRTRSVACHPGMSATQITFRSMDERGSKALGRFLVWGNALVSQPAERGAWPTLYAATHPSIRGGEYVGPTQLFGTRGHPGVMTSSPDSHDAALAARLWSASETMTGERFI